MSAREWGPPLQVGDEWEGDGASGTGQRESSPTRTLRPRPPSWPATGCARSDDADLSAMIPRTCEIVGYLALHIVQRWT